MEFCRCACLPFYRGAKTQKIARDLGRVTGIFLESALLSAYLRSFPQHQQRWENRKREETCFLTVGYHSLPEKV